MKLISIILFLLSNNIYCQISLSYIPAKKNFIYAGVENNITINGFDQLQKPSVKVFWASMKKNEDQTFSINPMNVDSCLIIVESLLDTRYVFSIKVKPTPEPDPYLDKILQNPVVKDSDIRIVDSIFLFTKDFDWQMFFKIDSFNVTKISYQSIISFTNVGAQFNDKTKELTKNASVDEIYIFDAIYYKKGNEKLRLSKSIVIRIK